MKISRPACSHVIPNPAAVFADGGEGSASPPAPAFPHRTFLFRSFFSLRADRPSPLVVHAGASLAGNDSSEASPTGSISSGVLFALLAVFVLFLGAIKFRALVGAPFAAAMRTAAIDVRHVLHRLALHAAITAILRRRTRTCWMRAFRRFPLSTRHIRLLASNLLLFDAPRQAAGPSPGSIRDARLPSPSLSSQTRVPKRAGCARFGVGAQPRFLRMGVKDLLFAFFSVGL